MIHKTKIITKLFAIALILQLVILLFIKYSTSYYTELFVSFWPSILLVFFFVLIVEFIIRIKINNRSLALLALLFLNLIFGITSAISIIKFYSPPQVFDNEFSRNSLKIYSLNLWWGNKNYDAVIDGIKEKDPDVLILIEFTDLQYNSMSSFLNENYPYMTETEDTFKLPYAGNVIYSKYPVINYEKIINFGYYSGYAYAEIEYDDEKYNIYAVHTTSPISKEYFYLRNEQLNIISDSVNNSEKANIIISGDFNLTPWSIWYAKFYKSISNQLKCILGLSGFKYSWDSQKNKLIKAHIDHTFVSNNLTLTKYEIIDVSGSDHDAQYFEIK